MAIRQSRFRQNEHGMHLVSRCLVNQARPIAANADRLRRLHETVGWSNDLKLHQWTHFYALALEYHPDLVIEFGRGYGNSTCVFAEALRHGDAASRLVSLCNSTSWTDVTLPKLKDLVDTAWLSRIDVRTGDIRVFNLAGIVADARRILVLWDAHGVAVADCVLARLMPLISDRDHFVVMHDVSDNRYTGNRFDYRGLPFWRGQEGGWSGDTARLYLGWIDTAVEQVIPAIDFTTRNHIELGSADHRVKLDICDDSALLQTLRATYPDGMFDPVNHWAFFTLNDADPPYTYPTYPAPPGKISGVANGADMPPVAINKPTETALHEQMARDLEQYRWFGRPSPVTYARVLAKLVTARYPDLKARPASEGHD
jgi:hypothetical protein